MNRRDFALAALAGGAGVTGIFFPRKIEASPQKTLEEAVKDKKSRGYQEWCHFFAETDPKVCLAMDNAIKRHLDPVSVPDTIDGPIKLEG